MSFIHLWFKFVKLRAGWPGLSPILYVDGHDSPFRTMLNVFPRMNSWNRSFFENHRGRQYNRNRQRVGSPVVEGTEMSYERLSGFFAEREADI